MVSAVILKGIYRTETTIFQFNAQVIGITEIHIEEEQVDGLLESTFCADEIYNDQRWAAYFTSDCGIGGSFFNDEEALRCRSPPSVLDLIFRAGGKKMKDRRYYIRKNGILSEVTYDEYQKYVSHKKLEGNVYFVCIQNSLMEVTEDMYMKHYRVIRRKST